MTDDFRKITNTIIFVQCAGQVGASTFDNGFMLNLLSKVGFGSEAILYLLALPTIVMTVICIPAAYLSDRKGKKAMGTAGLSGVMAGYLIIVAGSFFASRFFALFIIIGISVYSLGFSAFVSSWFALLSPLIPKDSRGRFFGKLRVSFQATALIATWVIFYIIDRNDSISTYIWILAFIAAASLIRVIIYMKIPEKETVVSGNTNIYTSFLQIIRVPRFISYSIYCFAIMLITGALPWIYGLLGKDVLGFSEGKIVMLGNMLLIGSLAGYYAGGKLCDKRGTKFIFSSCHIIFSLALILVLIRSGDPNAIMYMVMAAALILGFARAAIGIALSSNLLAILPSENKSFSSSIITTMLNLGTSLSAAISGRMVTMNILSKTDIFRRASSNYDIIILIILISLMILSALTRIFPSLLGPSNVCRTAQNRI